MWPASSRVAFATNKPLGAVTRENWNVSYFIHWLQITPRGNVLHVIWLVSRMLGMSNLSILQMLPSLQRRYRDTQTEDRLRSTSLRFLLFFSRLFFIGKLSKMDMDGVTVPRGFCLTMKFFESLIDEELRSLLRELEETSIRKSCERPRLEATCDNVRRKINRKRLIFFKNIHWRKIILNV